MQAADQFLFFTRIPCAMTPEKLGPYRIERLLGRGGMGAVYAGADEQTGRAAAIKVISTAWADDESFRERFAAEIETLKKLKHPHIVELYGYGAEYGLLFYAMELVPGRNLQDELNGGRRFGWREACRIGVEVCQALKHAHDRGVIHRDLKPANLLFGEEEQVKLSDFGIAKIFGVSQMTAEGGMLGTVDYMPLEQAEGRSVTLRSDLYSLGGVLYALLAGRPPFAAESLPAVIHSLRYDQPPPVRRFAPETPQEFERIIAELLEKDPANRIATALAVSNRLKAMEHALSVHAAPGELEAASSEPPSRDEAAPGGGASGPALAETRPDPASDADDVRPGRAAQSPTDAPATADYVDSALEIAPSWAPDASGPTSADRGPPAPGDSARRHFTTVDQEERRRAERMHGSRSEPPTGWLKIALVASGVAAVAALGWYATRPPSREQLYRRIVAAAQDGEVQSLLDVQTDMQQFLERFPDDDRCDEIIDYQENIELEKLQRRFELKASRTRAGHGLTPAEAACLDAIRTEHTDPESAAARLQAIVDVFGQQPDASPTQQRCVVMARHRLGKLRQSLENVSATRRTFVQRQLERVKTIALTEPEKAETILRGLTVLYGDQPWAAEEMKRTQETLQRLKSQEPADRSSESERPSSTSSGDSS